MARCSNCGSELGEQYAFCSNCGVEIVANPVEDGIETTQNTIDNDNADTQESADGHLGDTSQNQEEDRGETDRTIARVAIAIMVAILLVAAICSLISQGSNAQNDVQSEASTEASTTSEAPPEEAPNSDDLSSIEQVESGSAIESESEATAESEPATATKSLVSYRTRLCEQLNLAGPVFTFEYPENWTVTAESCQPDAFSEAVTLTSDTGKTIVFAYGNAVASTSGSATDVAADVDFNAEIYPDFKFPNSVPDYDRVGSTSADVKALKLQVRNWERPEQVGKGTGYVVTDSAGKDPAYYGRVQFICMGLASAGTDEFTAVEEREIVGILSSLRQEPAAFDAEAAAGVANVAERVIGSFQYLEDDGGSGLYMDRWELNADGTAADMMRMGKDDYTWAVTDELDSLSRPIIRFTPIGGGSVRNLCYDESLDALCEPGSPDAEYVRI